jgi:hypothetical protein
MTPALGFGRPVASPMFADIVRRMALDHEKWDAQVGDVAALAPFPVLLPRRTWHDLQALTEALARETLALERELAARPDLHARLGIAGALASALRIGPSSSPTPAPARIMRFDFHPTVEGWRVSEVNSDVPGGFTESSRFSELVAAGTGEGSVPGDAAASWLEAMAAVIRGGGAIALLCAPGWLEDVQVVAHLAARLRARGLRSFLATPHQLHWSDGRAYLEVGARAIDIDGIVRHYQAEWLAMLRDRASWMPLFRGATTPVTNPGSAALTESKRLPLVWSDLDACSTTWRSVLPETRDPREARDLWSGDWVLKPAFGNTGDDVMLRSTSSRSTWFRRVLGALTNPRRWVAQRRFGSAAIDSPRGPLHVCIGVYAVDGRAVGAYGRLSPSKVIDGEAIDAAVLLER